MKCTRVFTGAGVRHGPMRLWLPAVLLFAMPSLLHPQTAAHVRLEVSGSDTAAATAPLNFQFHILPANSPAARSVVAARGFGPSPTSSASIPSVPPPGFYPDDLVFFGGHVLTRTENHNIFVNCAVPDGGCWGNPAQFLQDLNLSQLIHVTDQYVSTTADDRYPVSTSVEMRFALFTNTSGQTDLLSIVHAAAKNLGTGYGHIYHVFLPKGVDTCFDQTAMCYSPDNPASFVFCAYHGSADFSDIGHVVFSVEPFQNVKGCQVAQPSPNGVLADSTNSVLSHELIESITDPDPPTGWVSAMSLLANGAEIGDLCEPLGNAQLQFLNPVISLNGHSYKIQLEYSNKFHGCASTP